MEDRITDELYLELCDAGPEDYAGSCVKEVLAVPGVERASWWENQRPRRDEFPRSIDEFRTLGVYEVGDGFQAPALHARVSAGHHFRRTPRPPQGSMSGRPTVGLLLVLISPRTPAGAQPLRDWADFNHIPAAISRRSAESHQDVRCIPPRRRRCR